MAGRAGAPLPLARDDGARQPAAALGQPSVSALAAIVYALVHVRAPSSGEELRVAPRPVCLAGAALVLAAVALGVEEEGGR